MTNAIEFQALTTMEQKDINGGAICAGLCIFAAGFVVGAVITIGVAVLAS